MKHRLYTLFCLIVLSACSGATTTDVSDANGTPSGGDTIVPFPIDAGSNTSSAPGTYKLLPLRLVDTGTPSVTPVDGVIGLVCVGMSNGVRECDDFQRRVGSEYASAVNPLVRVVNCAVGGNAIERWIDPSYDRDLWDACITKKIPAAGIRPNQVRVIWHKAADQFNALPGGASKPAYPDPASDYFTFIDHLSQFAGRMHTMFPSVQAVYTSSRSYGGFAGNQADRGEPLSYEEGHALNTWLGTHSNVDGVWYGWGAYLWAPSCASGTTNGAAVCYDREDFVNDGVHPSASGQAKVSALLHARFLREAWYRAQ